jgi:multiple sugar transport system permease protein
VQVFRELPLSRWMLNSLGVTLAITALQLLTSAMAGYALAKYSFRGRMGLFRFAVGRADVPVLHLPDPLVLHPALLPAGGRQRLDGQGGTGFLGTYAALILPFAVSWFGIFLMRQFFMAVPDELIDAARMDGAGEAFIFFRIAVPLVGSGLATLAIFVFLYHWNEVLWTMTVTRTNPDMQTMPVGIYLLRGPSNGRRPSRCSRLRFVSRSAGDRCFLLLQRYYVASVTSGSVKG